MAPDTIAALDLGSNTFRLMLAEARGGVWADRRVFQHIPRLSEALTDGGRFAPAALQRAWEALSDFDAKIKAAGAQKVLAGATMAARISAEGPSFMAEMHRRFGWETKILTGQEEAALSAAGVLTGLAPLPAEALIFDIGGRSTEFIAARGGRIEKSRSLAMGVVELTERFLGDPARPDQLAALAASVRKTLRAADFSDVGPAPVLVGTAGTVTTVAALLLDLKEYRPELVNNARLEQSAVAALLAALAAEPVAARVEKYGLHPRRADAIVAGLVLVLEILGNFRQPFLLASDNGLLEALWLKAAGLL
jgi:exopolyphosphatase/guanosine-5'-triphosphate,3'-diphosphate pyrophosphatase